MFQIPQIHPNQNTLGTVCSILSLIRLRTLTPTLRKIFPNAKSQNRRQTKERKSQKDHLPHITALESNNGIRNNQRYSTRNENHGTQKHPKHPAVHSAHQL